MSAFALLLGPKQCGAEVLVHLARQRLSGTLSYGPPTKPRHLLVREGRPEGLVEGEGPPQISKAVVVQQVRALATGTSGRCSFAPETSALQGPSLGIDTLGETMVAVLQVLQSNQVDTLLEARAATKVEATPLFAKLARALVSLGGAAIDIPNGPVTLKSCVPADDGPARRAWLAELLLGGLRGEGWALQFEGTPAASAVSAVSAASAAGSAPAAPAANQPLAQEVEAAFAKAAEQDYYAFLNVAHDASAEVIRKAYFELAKRWHADRLVNAGLDAATKTKAEELFRRADEANRILSNAEERKTYDWILERQAAGLPTDPRVVMEAEGLFRRAETLIRRGQAAAAEPLLRQAVQMNKGEAEFWAYLGFAVYCEQGNAGLVEAREHLDKAKKMREKLDVVHEFLGRIAHSEGERNKATFHLEQALEMNPRNTFAERELRLLNMRQEQEKKPAKDKGLLDRLLKR